MREPSMSAHSPTPPAPQLEARQEGNGAEHGPVSQNVESILEFYAGEESKISHSQRFVEGMSGSVGRPVFLAGILLIAGLWILANVYSSALGIEQFDEPPFFWLQGIVTLSALLTALVVLIKQNRMGKLQDQRAHLALQLSLLTEQKTTKVIDLLEELRRDLPMVKDRQDPEVKAFQEHIDPHRVLATIDEKLAPESQRKK